MHDVTIAGRHRPVPATWNELPPRLLLRLMPVLHAGGADASDLRLRLLFVLLQVNLATFLLITDVQLCQLLWLADFLVTDVRLTAQLLPMVRLPWARDWRRRRWFGPLEKMRNLRFLEFIFADAYFVAYSKNPAQAEWLDKLVAVLYRPQRRRYRPRAADYGGDRREDFNPVHVGVRADTLARLPLATKLAIYTWYRGCRGQLERDFPRVFTPAHEESASNAPSGWAHVAREMSGGAFGTLEQTEQQLVRVVLAKMEDDAYRAEVLAAHHRQQNP